MRERVEQLGGHFEVDSAPGIGTMVKAGVPLALTARVEPALAELRDNQD